MKLRRFAASPNVLSWARTSARLSDEEAARRIGVSITRLAEWERGDTEPTINQLRAAADAYNRPLAALFLTAPPEEEQVFDLPDFRRPESEGEESAALRKAILRAKRQQEALLDVREELGEDFLPPLQILQIDETDPEKAGHQLRGHLGLDKLPARSLAQPLELLRTLVRKVEERGYLVIQVQRVPVTEMRGFSISGDPAPVIALNGADWPRGKIYSFLHELAHVSLRHSGLCDLSRQSSAPEERYCDRVAAAALMPGRAFASLSRDLRIDPTSYTDLRTVSDRFGASAEAGLIRMIHLGLATWDDYAEMRGEFRSAYERHKQDEKDARSGRDTPIYYQLKVRDLGRPFIASMVRAHNEGALSSRDTARLLDVSYDKIPKLVDRITSAEVLA
ncbi:helix-turn-helix domain-containing protein [Arthrobacter sp. TMS2-4]